MVVHILLRVLAVICALSSKARCGNIHLGILVPMDYGTWKVGRGIIPIIGRAIREVNNSGILPGYNMTYTLRDSKCSSNTATGITADLMYSQPKVNAYIGPGCSAACTSAGLLAHYWKVPMISFSCSSSSLKNRNKYSTFARTQPFSRTYSGVTPEALLKIMQHYQWKRAAIVAPYGYKSDTIWEPIASSVRSHFLRNNITVPYYKVPHMGYNEFAQNERKQMLKTAKSQARVIFILAVREQVSSLIMLAKELNMLNGSYAFITLDFYVSDYLLSETANQTNTKITNDEILEAFNGIITLTVKRASKDEVKRTTKWLTDRMTSDPSNPSAVSGPAVRTAPFLHDAILLYAYALNRTLQAGQHMSNIDGKDLFYRMRSNSSLFTGMSGPVMIDRQGNRVPTFVVENVLFNDTQPLMELWYNGTIKEVFKVDTVWPGGGITRPDDNPECVFIKCILPGKSKLVRNSIITATVVLAVLFAAVFLFYYRKRKYEQDLLSKTWTISYKDITPVDLDVRFASKVIRNHYDTTSKWSRMTENNPPGTSNPHFGRYKDDFVALKRLRKDALNLTRDMLVEMKQVRDIVHVNLTQYIGVCLDPSNICIVSLYCHRGSLQEILANDARWGR